MNESFGITRRKLAIVAVLLLALAFAIASVAVHAHDETPGSIESYLHNLVADGAITEAQHATIERLYSQKQLDQLRMYLAAQETAGRLSRDMHLYISALLSLSTPAAIQAAAPADYTGNGNVTLLGQINVQPPNPYYGDNSSTGTLYNGIWGYATGSREYALQCNSFGLHIIDVTDPAAPFRVQFIDMSGGVSPPKGRIWRDVDIHQDPASGKTYAYIGAQSNGNLWVVDLSYLSGSAAHGVDSNPIPPAGIADRGRTNYGHTVFVNDGLGLLFMNSANNGSTLGCQIFDLLQNPFDPPLIASWSGSGHDCHDSYARANVPGSGGKDLLYVAEGYATRYRVIDITNVRSTGTTTLVGESAPVSGIYAHSNWPTEDSQFLYAFDEFNVRDIGVYDISNPASPTQVTTFQWSGDATANSRIHNGQVRGKYLLTAYYEAGFRVFDISNPANAVEVGKYETWRDPDGDGTFNQTITGNYNGAWNVHVFLPSGNVLLSDMKSGTFILRVDPVAVPGATSGLAATPGDEQVNLTWAATDGATGYSVHRATTSGGPYTTIKTNVVGTSFADTGLTNGTTYYYVVSGTNAEGEGAYSNEAFATPQVPTLPTTTTLSSAPNPSLTGQSVTFTATVTSNPPGGGVPTGSVTFSEGATVLASGVAVNGAGQAAFSTATLAAGSHVITAAFSGTGNWLNSSGDNSTAPQVVNAQVTFTSVAADDGWSVESSETSNVGGSINSTSSTASALRVGDDNQRKQYKTIVSFDTSSIPDGAAILSVTLRLRRGTFAGVNPFNTFGTCWVDVQSGSGFSGSTTLQAGDFQAVATALQGASLSNAANNLDWSEGSLNAAGLAAINKTGKTQLRIYFALDDNNNSANDYIGYYSGNNSTAANRPQLVVVYQ
ncbi:MAG TPA: choice-of-anchor B family protein [Blastocatellia bacterium]|nr:choice-of-anchor B family protein [Blastocatellia bacterium]